MKKLSVFLVFLIGYLFYVFVGLTALTVASHRVDVVDDLLDYSKFNKTDYFVIDDWRNKNGLDVHSVYGFYNVYFFSPSSMWNAFSVPSHSLIPNDEIGREFLEYVNTKNAMEEEISAGIRILEDRVKGRENGPK